GRDRAWTAAAFVSDHWLPISPVSGRLDAFEWKDPLAGEDHGTVIEHRAETPAPPIPATEPSPPVPHPQPLPASGEREPRQADKPASEEKEKAQRAVQEAGQHDPLSARVRSAHRATP